MLGVSVYNLKTVASLSTTWKSMSSPFDKSAEHRDEIEKPCDVAKYHPSLVSIGRDEHDGSPLTGGEDLSVIAECSKVDCDECRDPALSSSPPNAKPGFLERFARRRLAASVALIDVEVFLAYGKAEQCREQYSPCPPLGSAEFCAK